MPFTVGLTGGIGVGKSTVAGLFADCGAELVVGDELGKQAIELQPAVQNAIRKRFGGVFFDSGGVLNRRALGEKVFTDSSHVRWLTELTFPFIHAKWTEAVTNCRKEIIIFDAALIFEWGMQREFDKIVVVRADPELVSCRAASGRFDSRTISQRLRYQCPVEEKLAQADVIIDNSGTLDDLKEKVELLYEQWINSIRQN